MKQALLPQAQTKKFPIVSINSFRITNRNIKATYHVPKNASTLQVPVNSSSSVSMQGVHPDLQQVCSSFLSLLYFPGPDSLAVGQHSHLLMLLWDFVGTFSKCHCKITWFWSSEGPACFCFKDLAFGRWLILLQVQSGGQWEKGTLGGMGARLTKLVWWTLPDIKKQTAS